MYNLLRELLKLNEDSFALDAAILVTDNNIYKGVSVINTCFRDRIDAVSSVIGAALTNGDKRFKELYYLAKDDNFNLLNKDVIIEHLDNITINLVTENKIYKIKGEDFNYEKWLNMLSR